VFFVSFFSSFANTVLGNEGMEFSKTLPHDFSEPDLNLGAKFMRSISWNVGPKTAFFGWLYDDISTSQGSLLPRDWLITHRTLWWFRAFKVVVFVSSVKESAALAISLIFRSAVRPSVHLSGHLLSVRPLPINIYSACCGISVLTGGICMKLGTNMYCVSGH